MALTNTKKDNYVSILSSDGTFRLVVPEGTEGSIVREYETSDGKKGSKTELVFNKLDGMITNVEFHGGEFGKNLLVTVDDGQADPVVVSMNCAQAYGEDFMKKLPSIDLSKPVIISPYAFEDDKKKMKKGVSIVQNDAKVRNFFYDEVEKKETNGFPAPEGDTSTYDSDSWKVHFIKVRKFLVDYVEKNVMPKFKGAKPAAEGAPKDLLDEAADQFAQPPTQQ